MEIKRAEPQRNLTRPNVANNLFHLISDAGDLSALCPTMYTMYSNAYDHNTVAAAMAAAAASFAPTLDVAHSARSALPVSVGTNCNANGLLSSAALWNGSTQQQAAALAAAATAAAAAAALNKSHGTSNTNDSHGSSSASNAIAGVRPATISSSVDNSVSSGSIASMANGATYSSAGSGSTITSVSIVPNLNGSAGSAAVANRVNSYASTTSNLLNHSVNGRAYAAAAAAAAAAASGRVWPLLSSNNGHNSSPSAAVAAAAALQWSSALTNSSVTSPHSLLSATNSRQSLNSGYMLPVTHGPSLAVASNVFASQGSPQQSVAADSAANALASGANNANVCNNSDWTSILASYPSFGKSLLFGVFVWFLKFRPKQQTIAID